MRGPTFDVRRFEAGRRSRGLTLGVPVFAVATTGSTNDDALTGARAGAADGTLWIADEQTKGRGRRGSGWTSPAGLNLTISLLCRPRVALERASALPLAVGLSVRDAVARHVSSPVAVKWPNDVLVSGKKLAGILVESQLDGSRLAAVVIGIGLNVAMTELPEEIHAIATSLHLEGATDATREDVLCDVLEALEARLASFWRGGLAELAKDLAEHDALRGQRVSAGGLEGVACGMDATGALLIETSAGVERVITGAVVVH